MVRGSCLRRYKLTDPPLTVRMSFVSGDIFIGRFGPLRLFPYTYTLIRLLPVLLGCYITQCVHSPLRWIRSHTFNTHDAPSSPNTAFYRRRQIHQASLTSTIYTSSSTQQRKRYETPLTGLLHLSRSHNIPFDQTNSENPHLSSRSCSQEPLPETGWRSICKLQSTSYITGRSILNALEIL